MWLHIQTVLSASVRKCTTRFAKGDATCTFLLYSNHKVRNRQMVLDVWSRTYPTQIIWRVDSISEHRTMCEWAPEEMIVHELQPSNALCNEELPAWSIPDMHWMQVTMLKSSRPSLLSCVMDHITGCITRIARFRIKQTRSLMWVIRDTYPTCIQEASISLWQKHSPEHIILVLIPWHDGQWSQN